jgi:hypothetical protein
VKFIKDIENGTITFMKTYVAAREIAQLLQFQKRFGRVNSAVVKAVVVFHTLQISMLFGG